MVTWVNPSMVNEKQACHLWRLAAPSIDVLKNYTLMAPSKLSGGSLSTTKWVPLIWVDSSHGVFQQIDETSSRPQDGRRQKSVEVACWRETR